MSDTFNRKTIELQKPITADSAVLLWDGTLITKGTNISIQASRQNTRRYTLGGKGKNTAVMYPGRTQGTISISTLVAEDNVNMYELPGWNDCKGTATITLSLDGDSSFDGCSGKGGTYTFRGCLVQGTSIQVDAETLNVAENITIEFMQMEYTPPAA